MNPIIIGLIVLLISYASVVGYVRANPNSRLKFLVPKTFLAVASAVAPTPVVQPSIQPSQPHVPAPGPAGSTTESGKFQASFRKMCPVMKSLFSQQSYNLANINPSSLTEDSPNVKTVTNYCGLGNAIREHCADLKDLTGVTDPNYPDPTTCDTSQNCYDETGKAFTYSKLCKSLQSTLNFSAFKNSEWNIASGSKANVSSVFEDDGTLKFNIYSMKNDDNRYMLTGFCDRGREILEDPNAMKATQEYVANSAAYKFYCCNDNQCCPDNVPTCTNKPKCSTVCSKAASSCMQNKGQFISDSYDYQNINTGTFFDNEQNLNKFMDYCVYADDVAAADCKVDKYHPKSPVDTSLVLNPGAPEPVHASKIYQNYCTANPSCLPGIGKLNTDRWAYQTLAYDYFNPNRTDDWDFVSTIATCDNSKQSADTWQDWLASCVLNGNGERLVDYCNTGTVIQQNKCYDIIQVDPNNDTEATYPPIKYDPSYISLCCGLGLGDANVCNVDNNLVKNVAKNSLPAATNKIDFNKNFYRYAKNHNIVLQKNTPAPSTI